MIIAYTLPLAQRTTLPRTPRLAQRTPLGRTPRAARHIKHWGYWGKERTGLRREGLRREAGLAAVLRLRDWNTHRQAG